MITMFEIYNDKAGEFRFRLKAGNGEIILASEGYTTKDACENGIASVKENAQNPERYEIREAKNGEMYFVLKAGNGQEIGRSELYASGKSGAENGIASVTKNAKDADTKDLTAA